MVYQGFLDMTLHVNASSTPYFVRTKYARSATLSVDYLVLKVGRDRNLTQDSGLREHNASAMRREPRILAP